MAAKYPEMVDVHSSRAEKMGLNCPVCLEVYKEPKSLACLHTFCKTCIDMTVMKMRKNWTLKNGIECPLCRKTTVTGGKYSPPEEWAASLPNNYAILSVLDEVHSDEEYNTNEQTIGCQPCQKINMTMAASKYCLNCQEYQCVECVKIHDRFAFMKGHVLIEVDARENLKLFPVFGKLDQCDAHAKPIEFYCAEHSIVCCSSCAFKTHRTCEGFVEIQEIDIDNALSTTLIEELTELREKVELASIHFKKRDKEIEEQISALPEIIESLRVKLNTIVDDFKRKVLNEASELKKQNSAKINGTLAECESLIAALNASTCTHEDVANRGTPSQLFIAKHKIEEQLSMYEQKAEEQFKKLQSFFINIHIGEHMEEILESGKEVGSLTVSSTKESIESIMEHKPVNLERCPSIDVKDCGKWLQYSDERSILDDTFDPTGVDDDEFQLQVKIERSISDNPLDPFGDDDDDAERWDVIADTFEDTCNKTAGKKKSRRQTKHARRRGVLSTPAM